MKEFKNTIKAENITEILAENNKYNESTIDWNGYNIAVKSYLSLQDMMGFVRYVVDSCFDEDTYEYLPELKDFAFMSAVVIFYTDITLPESTSDTYDLFTKTDIVATVESNIDDVQLKKIYKAINDKIEHIAASGAMTQKKQLDNMMAEFGVLENTIAEIFSGVDNETLNALVGAMANSKIDEEKLVNAIATRDIGGEVNE